ncbi:RNA polymerase sigma factor [Lewinella sp. JB7]|uniref:RNA polymerase sigma factor n=1 Tax=Lewinella sp. JB7 TaxID=2962887 RepID=UPI0020CA0B25|nr:RNA polymerase sigma factor [Lewinella sp. JB7]MCP9236907.1 RNA polymerase sigma factor [Lewinella sp. JB7]
MTLTDETLMERVADNRLDCLAPLYERYKSPLLGFLLNRTNGDRATAEDLLQATFERIIKYRTSWRTGQNFKTWAFTIARNVHRDRCRREGRMPLSDDFEFGDLPLESPEEAPTDCRAALAALPDNYRIVVELAWQRNLKYADIARVLDTTEANVKVRMHRACKQLRANYQNANRL